MPYIPRDRREALLASAPPRTKGELAFVLTFQIVRYVRVHGRSFDTFGDVVAALETTKLEFNHRELRPYEDRKLIENGDVYGR